MVWASAGLVVLLVFLLLGMFAGARTECRAEYKQHNCTDADNEGNGLLSGLALLGFLCGALSGFSRRTLALNLTVVARRKDKDAGSDEQRSK